MAGESFADLSKIRVEMIKEKAENALDIFKSTGADIQWVGLRLEKPLLEELLRLIEQAEETEQLRKDVHFFKKRQEVSTKITQELASLNDDRVRGILMKTRII